MAFPVSANFDVVDYNNLKGQTGSSFSLQEAHLTNYATFPHGNVVVDSGYAVFNADASGSPDLVRRATMLITESLPRGIPASFTVEFTIHFPTTTVNGAEEAHMPLDFSSPDSRIGVGAFSKNGCAGYFLFSHQGLAIANSIDDPSPRALGGSHDIIFDPETGLPYAEGINMRVVVNSEEKRLYLYAGRLSSVYEVDVEGNYSEYTDAELRYSPSAPVSKELYGDVVAAAARARGANILDGDVGEDIAFYLSSLRVSSVARTPVNRPVSVASAPSQAVVGAPIQPSGLGSYDPLSRDLTYDWKILVRPQGDKSSKLQGRQNSFTFLGTAAANNRLKFTFVEPDSSYNGYRLKVVEGNPGSSLLIEHLSARREIRITLAVSVSGDILTSAEDLVIAFSDPRTPGYNIRLSGGTDQLTGETFDPIIRVEFPSSASSGSGTVGTEEAVFSGGTASNLTRPIFIPAKEGIYVFGLVVDNGVRKSFMNRAVVSAQLSEQLLGHRPDSSYIFKYLPDFWNLVPEKSQLEPAWAAATQAISADLTSLWQTDLNKAIRDISRKYQRRWQAYSMSFEFDGSVGTKFVHPPVLADSLDIYQMNAVPALSGSAPKANSSALFRGSEAFFIDHALEDPTFINREVAPSDSLEISVGTTAYPSEVGYAKYLMRVEGEPLQVRSILKTHATTAQFRSHISSSGTFPKHRVIATRTAGRFVRDPLAARVTPERSVILSDGSYAMSQIRPGKDYVIVTLGDEGSRNENLTVARVIGLNPNGVANSVELDIAPQLVDGRAINWYHVVPIERFTLERVPYLYFDNNLSESFFDGIGAGDVFVGTFLEPVTAREITLGLPILAVEEQCLFLDWLPLMSAFRLLLAQTGNDVESPDLYANYSDLSSVGITPVSVKRCRTLSDVQDLVSIPRLQENTTSQPQGPYYDGIDYTVSDTGGIRVTDWIRAKGRVDWADPNTILVENKDSHFLIKHSDLSGFPENSGGWTEQSQVLLSKGLSTVVVDIGAHGVYTISGFSDAIPGSTSSGVRIHLGRTLFPAGEYQYKGSSDQDTGSVEVSLYIPRYSFLLEPPARLWAEVSYFDNAKAIEYNVGLFVGLPKKVVDAADADLDYLSVVRSAWFGLMSGPSIENLKLTAQAFLDLPYAEKPGRITYMSRPGSVLIKNSDGSVSRVVDKSEEGSIIVRNTDGTTTTYRYKEGMSVATNPRTGRPFAAYSSSITPPVDDPDYNNFLDAQVESYEALVDVVSIVDYVDNPETIQRQFSGELSSLTLEDGRVLSIDEPPTLVEQYHTFMLDVPLNLVRTTQAFDLIREFMMEAKPAYTRFILVGSMSLSDEIDVIDTPLISPSIYLRDTPASSPVSMPLLYDHELKILDGESNARQREINQTVLGGKIFRVVVPDNPDSFYHNQEAHVWPEEATINRDWSLDGHRVYNPESAISNSQAKILSDVAEKYESGYSEGVLDDYSGDGSHNLLRSEIEMVNTADGDIDTMRSKVWVPIRRWTDEDREGQSDVEFNVGDYVNIFIPAELNQAATSPDRDSLQSEWGIIEYIGSGEHPRLPGVFSPQAEHPYTYLLIGFDRTQPGVRQSAFANSHESGTLDNFFTYDHKRRFITAGFDYDNNPAPKAEILPINDDGNVDLSFAGNYGPERSNPNHAKYFLLEYIWQTDKLIEYGPKSDPTFTLTMYVGLDGMDTDDLLRINGLRVGMDNAFNIPLENFLDDDFADPRMSNFRFAVETPLMPYNPQEDHHQQFVPKNSVTKTNPSQWANKYRWGHRNAGAVNVDVDPYLLTFFSWSNQRMALGDPTRNPQNSAHARNYVQNAHIGITMSARKDNHRTSGFVQFKIPPPTIKLIQHNEDGTLRICGFYFCADDPTRENVPGLNHFGTGHPADYDGLIGGSWVHFRDAQTLVEYPVRLAPVFVTVNPLVNGVGEKVTGISHYRSDGSIAYLRETDKIDGKVLEITPPILPHGLYDIIVRNYRPYQMRQNGGWAYHVDSAVAARAWSVDGDGPVLDWGTGPFGQAPFGGG